MEGTRESRGDAEKITPEKFGVEVGTYSKEAQERIAALSSLTLEGDIKKKIQQSPEELKLISDGLMKEGLSDKQVNYVFRFFDLPQQNLLPQGKNREGLS